MAKKILSILLILVILGGVFTACAQELPAVSSVNTTELPNDTSKTTEGIETEPPTTAVPIVMNGVSNYVVVYDNDLSTYTKNSLTALFGKLTETHGMTLPCYHDEQIIDDDAPINEILIGATNRVESAEIASELVRGEEYILAFDQADEYESLLIHATTEKKLLEAVQYFLDTYADVTERSIVIENDLHYAKATASYPIQTLTVNGVSIARYSIVVPKNCDLLTYYAGLNLRDHIYNQSGYELTLCYDDTAEQSHEILVGDTNRDQSETDGLSGAQYILMRNDTKLVMKGTGVYAAAGVGAFVSTYLLPDANDTQNRVVAVNDLPTTAEKKTYSFSSTYRNAILMIGDGMGFNHVKAALANGLPAFVADGLPVIGKSVTRSYSVIYNGAAYTDSAASATAMATGYKTLNNVLGMDHNKKSVQNVRELAAAYGAQTAVLSTDALTGATPGAFLAHSTHRNNADIATQVNAIKNDLDYCLGSINGDKLTDETRNALRALTDSSAPFFMMVEEGHIDKRAHKNDMDGTLEHVKYYNDVIAYVICFTLCHPDTALIITADHETGGITPDSSSKYKYGFTTGNHTNANVPLYAFGAGVEVFHNVATENINIAKFIAKAFGAKTFGQSWSCPAVAA